MAAITQFDPYGVLSRKIGYSVGLEHLVRNVGLLVALYVQDRRLTYAGWSELVTSDKGFGRNAAAVTHFANLYLALGIIRVVGREVHSLHRLDCLSILRRLLTDDSEFSSAVQFVIAIAIMESDGDIFLNALQAKFELEPASEAIRKCLETKWNEYSKVLPNKGGQARLWDQLRIKSFKVDSAAKKQGPKVALRTEAIDVAMKGIRERRQDYELSVPLQYAQKALPPRKNWAADIGLITKEGILTDRGVALFRQLAAIDLVKDHTVLFWPYEHELNAIKIDGHKIGKNPLHSWDVISAAAAAWGSGPAMKQPSDSELAKFIVKVFKEYQAGDITKQLLRQQLPLFLLYPTYAAYCVARSESLADLPRFLSRMYKAPERQFNFVAIRGTEGGIQINKKSKQ